MFKNYLKTGLRNLLKTKALSLIHVLGLAIGMTACLLILHYVAFERSYDRFHANSEHIFRLRYERISDNGEAVRFASCCPPAGGLIRGNYPEVDAVARLFRYRASVSVQDTKFIEERMYFAEADFFKIFNWKITSGNPDALRGTNRALVSQATARKYFGSSNPLGKIFSVDKKTDYEIAGVFADIPHHSHVKFDILLSFQNIVPLYGPDILNSWGDTGFFTYLLLKPGTDLTALQGKLQKMVESSFGAALRAYRMQMRLPLQPMTDIHLNSHFMQEYETNGNRETVNLLFLIALFIIALAWVNYINLSTARSLTRAREVGLRKVVGASRRQLAAQFFCEIIMLNTLAAGITLVLVQLASPLFSQVTVTPPALGVWRQGWFWLALPLMFAGGVFLSGLYPVAIMTAFQPADVIKGRLGGAAKGVALRKILVSFQFVMALLLLFGTFAVAAQIRFLQRQKLGFDSRHIMVFKAPRVRDERFKERFTTFKQVLLEQSAISKACVATEVPGRQILWDAGAIRKAGEPASQGKNYQIVGTDDDFLNVFDLRLAAGRFFSRKFPADEKALLLNETARKWMGFAGNEAALGQPVNYWDETFTIIGVLKDFHQQSPKQAFEPHIFRYLPYGRDVRGNFALKLNTRNTAATVEMIRRQYDAFFPGNPFEYFFLDGYFNEQYRDDRIFSNVFVIFSFLAVVISSLGIFGLSSFLTIQRKKEIGIRKVLGASLARILYLLSGDFLRLLLLSFAIALPLAWILLHHWLRSFAVRMSPAAWLFLLPPLMVAAVTLLTISVHIVRAARANPVASLKYE